MTLNHTLRTELQATWHYFLRPVAILRGYRKEYLRPDFLAGLTVAIIMLPQAIAFALIAELPPEMGLYTAIAGSIIAGLWGSSNHVQTGPTNTTSLLVLSALLLIARPNTPEYLVTAGLLALLVGVFRLGMGIARLGVMVNFVSDSVIVGFTAGAGVLIFAGQLRHLLRLSIPSTPGLRETLSLVVGNLAQTHAISLGLGVLAILAVLGFKRLNPRLPGALLAMVITSSLVALFDLEAQGVRVISELPRSLPAMADLAGLDFKLLGELVPGALAVAAIGLVETMSIGRVIAAQTRQRLDSNQEFIGQGLANLVCGLFSAYPCSGSFTRSAVNYKAGAVTSLASVFAGLIVLVSMLVFAPLARYIPMAALAGVLILTAYGLVDRQEIKRIWQGGRGDRVIMVATLFAALALPLEYAVLSGISISLVYYLLQTSTPRVMAVVPNETYQFLVSEEGRASCPQLGIIEILGDLYFGAVHHVEDFLAHYREQHPEQRYLLFRLQSMEHCDISGIHALEATVRTYRQMGGDVFLSRCKAPILEIMQSSGFLAMLGADHLLVRDQDALGHMFYKVLDPAICIYECPIRAFKECQSLAKRLDLVGELTHTSRPHIAVPEVPANILWREMHTLTPPLVVDVREPREFKRFHIPGARLISLPALLRAPEQLDPAQPTVFVCQGGRRSTRAAAELFTKGFTSVRILQGGMTAWEAANLIGAIEGMEGD
ncbi:MAG: STAS domain-containing protein [Anaerolineales bacterium]|nr:STAS domain-containing protein [Anaerolineales bacterium]